jgi:hypothetical protein
MYLKLVFEMSLTDFIALVIYIYIYIYIWIKLACYLKSLCYLAQACIFLACVTLSHARPRHLESELISHSRASVSSHQTKRLCTLLFGCFTIDGFLDGLNNIRYQTFTMFPILLQLRRHAHLSLQ